MVSMFNFFSKKPTGSFVFYKDIEMDALVSKKVLNIRSILDRSATHIYSYYFYNLAIIHIIDF